VRKAPKSPKHQSISFKFCLWGIFLQVGLRMTTVIVTTFGCVLCGSAVFVNFVFAVLFILPTLFVSCGQQNKSEPRKTYSCLTFCNTCIYFLQKEKACFLTKDQEKRSCF
jgi:hypothetical protein